MTRRPRLECTCHDLAAAARAAFAGKPEPFCPEHDAERERIAAAVARNDRIREALGLATKKRDVDVEHDASPVDGLAAALRAKVPPRPDASSTSSAEPLNGPGIVGTVTSIFAGARQVTDRDGSFGGGDAA